MEETLLNSPLVVLVVLDGHPLSSLASGQSATPLQRADSETHWPVVEHVNSVLRQTDGGGGAKQAVPTLVSGRN